MNNIKNNIKVDKKFQNKNANALNLHRFRKHVGISSKHAYYKYSGFLEINHKNYSVDIVFNHNNILILFKTIKDILHHWHLVGDTNFVYTGQYIIIPIQNVQKLLYTIHYLYASLFIKFTQSVKLKIISIHKNKLKLIPIIIKNMKRA